MNFANSYCFTKYIAFQRNAIIILANIHLFITSCRLNEIFYYFQNGQDFTSKILTFLTKLLEKYLGIHVI